MKRHIFIRGLFISICSLAILSLIIFLYTVNHANVPQFWTELISYGLSILTPVLSFLLGEIRAKDEAEITFADRVEQIINRMESFERNNRGVPNGGSSYQSNSSSTHILHQYI